MRQVASGCVCLQESVSNDVSFAWPQRELRSAVAIDTATEVLTEFISARMLGSEHQGLQGADASWND